MASFVEDVDSGDFILKGDHLALCTGPPCDGLISVIELNVTLDALVHSEYVFNPETIIVPMKSMSELVLVKNNPVEYHTSRLWFTDIENVFPQFSATLCTVTLDFGPTVVVPGYLIILSSIILDGRGDANEESGHPSELYKNYSLWLPPPPLSVIVGPRNVRDPDRDMMLKAWDLSSHLLGHPVSLVIFVNIHC
jgi:hypothetical protein